MSLVKRYRVFALLMVVALLVGAFAPATLAQDAPLKLGFVVHVIGNPFIQQIVEGAKAAAADLNIELTADGPEGFDADAQLVAVQNFIAAGAQGVATSIPGESMANGLNDIIASGVPIVQFNLLSTSVNAPYVGERSVESGRILARYVLDKLGGADAAAGKVILGICAPGFPVLENRAKGVLEVLAGAPGIEALGPFDVQADPVENYSRWEQQLAANSDAVAMIGLCAPDVESLGKLNEANGDRLVMGGYDLTEGNLKAIQEGHAYVTIGQSPFVQGYLPIYMLAENLRNGTPLEPKFYDSGTQVVLADTVEMGNGLPSLGFDELIALSSDAAATKEFYQPWVDCITSPGWKCMGEPIANESA